MGCNWSKRSSAANEPVAVGPYEELEEDQEGSRKKPATLSFRAEMEGGGERSSTFDHIPRFVPVCHPPAVLSVPPFPPFRSTFRFDA